MSGTRGVARALILAGGSGTRLWPLSTDDRPKPFLPLAGDGSLLRDTFRRAADLVSSENVLVSGRRAHEALIRRDLPEIPSERLVLEPMRRNTAPAIGLSALVAGEDAVLVVLPSDQAVRDERAFLSALNDAVSLAGEGDVFVTIGIPPTRPETGFGYLRTGAEEARGARRVVEFVEKPSLEVARQYVAAGDYLWNAGIFVFRVSLLLSEMERLCPGVLEPVRRAKASLDEGDHEAFAAAFASASSISIDYAVMEKTPNVLTVPCSCGWSDLGSWEAVWEFRGGASGSNVLAGPAVCVDGASNLVLSDGRPIRVIGLSGIVVVDSPDGVLVMKQGASDALRKSVEETLKR